MTTILDQIFETKRRRVAELKVSTDIGQLISAAEEARAGRTPHAFHRAFDDRRRLNIIAEFKRASPSRGSISDDKEPGDIARKYESGGAAAMSVLTEEDYFKGSLNDLAAARQSSSIPILRKDFIFDRFQILEAAMAGADAILLIVASLSHHELADLRTFTEDELGMDALVETHTADELKAAIDIGATLVGVNNRNLKTFEVSLDTSRKLIELGRNEATLIAESGLRSAEDLVELHSLGYAGFLIGETMMTSDDPVEELRKLTQLNG